MSDGPLCCEALPRIGHWRFSIAMTPREMRPDCYPDFIIVGAAKAGTTSLAAMLETHEDVFISSPKEPHYFSLGWQTRREEYENLFCGRSERFRGEASTTYSQGPFGDSVPRRIQETIPRVRLIYLLRNPIDRIRSQYIHWVDRGREHRDIETAVREEPRYIDHSKYGRQLEEYSRYFPPSQILVIANESLSGDTQSCLRQVLEFIGADPDRLGPQPTLQLNRSIDKRESSPLLDSLRVWARKHGALRFVSPRGRELIHRGLSQPVDKAKAEISPELAAYVWAQLEADQALLRTFVEPSFPVWSPG